MLTATPPLRVTVASVTDLLKAIGTGKKVSQQPYMVLTGSPPRWHKFDPAKHADHAGPALHLQTQAAAVVKLHATIGEQALHAMPHAEMMAAIDDHAAQIQAVKSASAAVSGFKASVLAGKKPTPAQLTAFNALPDDKRKAFLEELKAQQPGAPGLIIAAIHDAEKAGGAKPAAVAAPAPKPALVPTESIVDPVEAGAYKVGDTVKVADDLQTVDKGKTGTIVGVKPYGGYFFVEFDTGGSDWFQTGEISPHRAAPPAKPAAAPAAPLKYAPPGISTFHNKTDGSNKFWSVAVVGSDLVTHYGPIGKAGQVTKKPMGSQAAALSAMSALVKEKKAKGYAIASTQPMPDSVLQAPAPAQAPTPAPPAVAAPVASPAASAPAKQPAKAGMGDSLGSIDGWAVTGGQKGSNPGGRFKAPDGSEWYCKFPASEDHVQNEILAAALYQAAGVKVPTLCKVTQGGKVGVASKWEGGVAKADPSDLASAPGAFDGFAVDAWLANWDAVGLATDNLLVDKSGDAVRIDVGGSLLFRAQGSPKGAAFGTEVGELDTLRGKSLDPAKNNAQAAAVFGKMTNEEIAMSIAHVITVSPTTVRSLVGLHGPGGKAEQSSLAGKLIARQKFLNSWVEKNAPDMPTVKPEPAPAKPVKPAKPPSEAAMNAGPKNGDTKPGANGATLVFKDGHWILQAEAPKEKPPIALPPPPVMKGSALGQQLLEVMQAAVQAQDFEKFKVSAAAAKNKAGYSTLLKWKNLAMWAATVEKIGFPLQPAAQPAAPAAPAAPKPAAAKPAAAKAPVGNRAAMVNVGEALDSAQLPTTNTNHVAVNKKLAAIKAALFAQDVPALKAMTFGSNTYGVKAAKLRDAAVVALTAGGAAEPPAAAPKPAAVVSAKEVKPAAKKPRLDESKLPVNPSDLPPVHDFLNWKGAGQGLSSSASVNKSNLADEHVLLELAKTGNLIALKAYQYTAVSKDTGAPTGKKPIDQHPSQHVKAFHSDLVAYLEAIAHPPKPLSVVDAKAGSIADLAKSAGFEKLGQTSSKVTGDKRLTYFIGLSKATQPAKFVPAASSHFSAEAKAKAKANHSKKSKLARHFISSVQSSGSYNNVFRDGKSVDGSGNSAAAVAAACYADADAMPAGTTIYRWMNMPDGMVKQLLAAPDGLIFQNPGSMCCSMSPTETSGFGEHRLVIRYAEGAKAMNSFGSGKFVGEQEVTALMGQRYMIIKKAMVAGKYGGSNRLELELLMLPPDPGYVADLQAQAATMAKALNLIVSAVALG